MQCCRFQPERTLYLAFGHDEEVGGGFGAKAIAEYLKGQEVQVEYVLDEGGPLLVDGLQPFIRDKAVALIGTAEKVLCQFWHTSMRSLTAQCTPTWHTYHGPPCGPCHAIRLVG